jgi:hypothetical protein
MVLDQIASRRTELTGEVELLRKQLADAEHELERLVIAEQVIPSSRPVPPTASRTAPGRRSGASGCWSPRAARHPARATSRMTTGRCWRQSPRPRPKPAVR